MLLALGKVGIEIRNKTDITRNAVNFRSYTKVARSTECSIRLVTTKIRSGTVDGYDR